MKSGRILGPADLARIRILISKNHILGDEVARVHPDGDWVNINTIPEIAEILVAKIAGQLKVEPAPKPQIKSSGVTQALPKTTPEMTVVKVIRPPTLSKSKVADVPSPSEQKEVNEIRLSSGQKTVSDGSRKILSGPIDEDKTIVISESDEGTEQFDLEEYELENGESQPLAPINQVANQETIVFERSRPQPIKQGPRRRNRWEIFKIVLAFAAVSLIVIQFLIGNSSTKTPQWKQIRPELPRFHDKADPEKSSKIYSEAIPIYALDTVVGYRRAAELFRTSATLDQNNVKALAMLASSYLNLIDVSNKDEKYFDVISKLIEMTRAKSVDLSETVIADVEYYIMANKPEAAQSRIVEFTKAHQNFGVEMYYYIALAYFYRGDAANAARYLSQIPENRVFSAKIFYLRGQVAEKLDDDASALAEYHKALKMNSGHARSRLRIANILYKRGTLKEASEHLEFIVNHPTFLAWKDLSQAYFLHAQLEELSRNYEQALTDIERAVRLDSENHEYLLELYTLLAHQGESSRTAKREARMYFFLSEGEKKFRQGKAQEALTEFLRARDANDRSYVPLVKTGDMFRSLNDLSNAKLNYKMAADRVPSSISIWSKYIDVLIQSYEWDEAKKAMERFRELPVNQSTIDREQADLFQKQGRVTEAQIYYKKAMSREVIDSGVYLGYAKSLMSTNNFKEAPFFFALALRFDPLNTEALIGTAKCIAETDSLERAIGALQDELQKGLSNSVELLSAIAELQARKGEWDLAQQSVDQAMRLNPDAAAPWKVQATLFLRKEGTDKTALKKALESYQAYAVRNPSDPSGYLERFLIYAKRGDFEKASDELAKIYGIYPKYPSLHYYKGMLYSAMGNRKLSVQEFRTELANNPGNVNAFVALGKEMIETGAYVDALKYFNQALELAPRAAEPKHWSGYANYLLKNYEGAVALYNAALAIDRGNALLYKRLGMAYRDMGNQEAAAGAFQKYFEMEPDAPEKAALERR